jgi:hypothetical protein
LAEKGFYCRLERLGEGGCYLRGEGACVLLKPDFTGVKEKAVFTNGGNPPAAVLNIPGKGKTVGRRLRPDLMGSACVYPNFCQCVFTIGS